MIIQTQAKAKNKAYRYKARYEKQGYTVTIEDDGFGFNVRRDNGTIKAGSSFPYETDNIPCKECGEAFTPDKAKKLITICAKCYRAKRRKYARLRTYKCVVCGDKKPEKDVTDHENEDGTKKGLWCGVCYRADMDRIDEKYDIDEVMSGKSQMSCGIDQIRRHGC